MTIGTLVRLPALTCRLRKPKDANRRSNEPSCAGRRVLRFGVYARAKSRMRNQGQHQLQRRAHLPSAGAALLRQDRNQLEQRGTLVLHRARSRRCRLAKSESLEWFVMAKISFNRAEKFDLQLNQALLNERRHRFAPKRLYTGHRWTSQSGTSAPWRLAPRQAHGEH